MEEISRFKLTVCPGSSEHPEKIINIFATENDRLNHFLIITIF